MQGHYDPMYPSYMPYMTGYQQETHIENLDGPPSTKRIRIEAGEELSHIPSTELSDNSNDEVSSVVDSLLLSSFDRSSSDQDYSLPSGNNSLIFESDNDLLTNGPWTSTFTHPLSLSSLEKGSNDRLDPPAYPYVYISWLDNSIQQHIDEQSVVSIGEYINRTNEI